MSDAEPIFASSEVKRIELRSKRLIDSNILGRYRSAFRGSGLVFSDLREYEPGDEIKHISWKASARSGKIFVKKFQEDRQLRIFLAMDISNSTSTGTRRSKFARGLEFCALVSTLARQSGDALGLCTFADKVLDFSPPTTKRNQIHLVLNTLLNKRDLPKATNLNLAFEYLLKHQRQSSVMFVISDFLSAGYEDNLRRLAFKHDLIAVLLEDPLDCELPEAGLVEFTDAETGLRQVVDTGTRLGQEKLRALHFRRKKELSDLLKSCGADMITIDRSSVEPLAELMNRRTRAIK